MYYQSSSTSNAPPSYSASVKPHGTSGQSKRLYCVAGKVKNEPRFRITQFIPETQNWGLIYMGNPKNLSYALPRCPVASISGKIYISIHPCGPMLSFEHKTGSVTTLPCRGFPDSWWALASINNVLFRSGGYEKTEETKPFAESLTDTETKYTPLNDVFRYIPESNTWQKVASMGHARAGHLMVTGSESLFVIGGGPSVVEEYYPEANIWFPCTVSGIQRGYSTGSYHKGFVYLCGEGIFQRIRPHPHQATSAEVLLAPPNSRANSLVSFNGKLLSVGGCLGKGNIAQTAMVYEFDDRGCWIRLPDMEVPKKRHVCVVVDS